MSFPFAVWFGKIAKRGRQRALEAFEPAIVDALKVPDMTGRTIGMDFLVADLMHDAQKSQPNMGDAVIVLDICGMGVTVRSDKRGNFRDGHPHRQKGEGVHNPAFDRFIVDLADGSEDDYCRYQIRPCGLARRTWVVVL